MHISGNELKKLFVEPILQRKNIGSKLLAYAINEMHVQYLWALEKNTKAIAFYLRHGFIMTNEKKYEEGTTEYLIRLERDEES